LATCYAAENENPASTDTTVLRVKEISNGAAGNLDPCQSVISDNGIAGSA
jgi:hypothetical protein